MKKALVGISLILFVAGIWWFFVGDDEVDLSDFHVESDQQGEVRKHLNLSQREDALKNIDKSNAAKLNGRIVLGEFMKPLDSWPEKINFINKVDPNWDKKTTAHLNEASTYDRQVKIIKKGGFVALNGDSGLYLERALVEFKQPDGSDGSFEAVINSQNGEIELVLNKNINESLAVEEPKVNYPDPYDPKNFLASSEEIRQLEEADSDEIVEAMVQEANDDFDEYAYEDQIAEQAEEVAAQDTDENHKQFVDQLKRDIAQEQ